jgi:hypothetical protein
LPSSGDAGISEASRASERRGIEAGAVESVVSVGLAVDHPSGWSGGARLRHFGSAPLIEDDSVRWDPTTLVNLEARYPITNNIQLRATF